MAAFVFQVTSVYGTPATISKAELLERDTRLQHHLVTS
jgi:hypothetical protein